MKRRVRPGERALWRVIGGGGVGGAHCRAECSHVKDMTTS